MAADLPATFLHIRVEHPAEGIWSLLKRHLTDLTHLARVIKRKLKKIQYWPHLIDGYLSPVGLAKDHVVIRAPDITSSP